MSEADDLQAISNNLNKLTDQLTKNTEASSTPESKVISWLVAGGMASIAAICGTIFVAGGNWQEVKGDVKAIHNFVQSKHEIQNAKIDQIQLLVNELKSLLSAQRKENNDSIKEMRQEINRLQTDIAELKASRDK